MPNWTYSQDMVGRRPDPPMIPAGGEFDPKDKSHSTKCRKFLNHVFRYNTTKRCELERQWNRARCFDMLHQWLQPSRTTITGNRMWYSWEPMRLRNGSSPFPRPQHNIFSPAIQDEVARLVKVGTKPYIRADDQDKQDGALLAKNILAYRNQMTGWPKQDRVGSYHMAMFGQRVQVSKWDINTMNTERMPLLSAIGCEHYNDSDNPCPFVLGNPEGLDGGQMETLAGKFGGGAETALEQGKCPRCGGQLGEVDMSRDQFESEPDAVGLPLYADKERGEDTTEVVSPFSAFPFNQGVGYESALEMEDIGIRTLRSMAYLKSRYANAHDLKPEISVELLEHHPSVAGAWGLSPSEEGLWSHHRAEDVYVMRPQPGFSRGMLLVMSGDRLLFHGELYIPETDIPRYEVGWAQWELRENEIWGKPLAEDIAALQVIVNSTLAQGLDIQQKFTSPKVLLHEGMNLQFQGGTNSVMPGDVWTINTRGIDPAIASKFPTIFGHQGIPDSLFKIFEIAKAHVADASGAHAAEIGAVQGVELNYSALLFAASKSAERRGPRTQDVRGLKIMLWNHRLRMVAALYDTPRLLKFQNDREEWKALEIRGFQLQGQTDVTLEEEPFVDDGVARRASISQGIQWGTIKTSTMGGTFAGDRRINRAIGVPEELNEVDNLQQDQARGEWRNLLDSGYEPMIDVTSDNHLIHEAEDRVNLAGKDALQLREACVTWTMPDGAASGEDYRWANILRVTWRWEQMLNELLQAKQVLETAPKPEQMVEMGAQLPDLVEMKAKLQQAEEMVAGFPDAIELQIADVWGRLIQSAGLTMIEPLALLVRMNSHRLGHWKLMQGLGMPPAAQPAGQPPAALGGDASAGMGPPGGLPAPVTPPVGMDQAVGPSIAA